MHLVFGCLQAFSADLQGNTLLVKAPGMPDFELKLPFGVDEDRIDALIQNDSHLLFKLPYAPIAQSRVDAPQPLSHPDF